MNAMAQVTDVSTGIRYMASCDSHENPETVAARAAEFYGLDADNMRADRIRSIENNADGAPVIDRRV